MKHSKNASVEKKHKAKLAKEACRFRKALEKSSVKLGVVFAEFPSGACGDASLLLAKHLQNKQLGEFKYICGWTTNSDGQDFSHAWLQQENLLIDITADQFASHFKSVVVTQENNWYKNFTRREEIPITARLPGELNSLFKIVESELENCKEVKS